MSGKKLSIHTIHCGVKKIFNCLQADFLREVSYHYRLPEYEIQLYDSVQEKPISVYDLRDLMHVEIVGRGETPQPVNNRMLRSNDGQSSKVLTGVETIIKKLRENTTLNGSERKFLIDHLERDASCDSLKRKRSEENGLVSPKQTSNKKLQVCVKNSKDSFCQTEELYKEVAKRTSLNKEEMIEKMKNIATSDAYDADEVHDLMLASYNDRRTFILFENPLVPVVKEKYPLLFSASEVKNELDRIFCKGKCETFLKNVSKYADAILKLKANEDDAIYVKTMKYMDRGKTEAQKNYARDVGSILMIPSILDENLEFIKLLDNFTKPGKYPHIKAETTTIKELFSDQYLFKIVVEEVQLCEAPNFKEAVLCFMASYFIFNIEYPKSCQRTHVILEKVYLEANDTHQIDNPTQQLLDYLKHCSPGNS